MQLIATGCLASLDEKLQELIPGIASVVPNTVKDKLVEDLVGEIPEDNYIQRIPIAGSRRRTRAFIKAQDGCNHHCTFCITRLARGKSRSIPHEQVCEDVRRAVRGGAREIVLTGVQLGSWGSDMDPRLSLAELLQRILDVVPEDFRVRVSSIEPWDVDEKLVRVWQDPRMCPHFHLPLQSGSDRILKLMGRNTTTRGYADTIQLVRSYHPGAAISTDIITGFPGETDADFAETLAYIHQIKFSSGHPFSYSARRGTPAAGFSDQIHGTIRHQRSNMVKEAFQECSREYREKWLGEVVEVLWESAQKEDNHWRMGGWSKEYIRVEAINVLPIKNQVDRIKIKTLTPDGCEGEIL